ncbi:MAG: helix-turn-helix domain-containing protein [Rubrobacter sp.]
MERSAVGRNLARARERRMWTQVRLAGEAGVSPTTVSGIESGRILRPHFGTLRKLAGVLGVEPEELLTSAGAAQSAGVPSSLSLEWSMSSGHEEFERGLEDASIEGLSSLLDELDEEEGRLQRLYGEGRGSEQRRLIKSMIRQVAAHSGSVEASIMAHPDNEAPEDAGYRSQPG